MGGKIEAGKTVSFRIPVDTPQEMVDSLNALREREGTNFSRTLSQMVFHALEAGGDSLTLPLPVGLRDDQREWLSNPNTKALLSGWLAQIVSQPSLVFSIPLSVPREEKSGDTPPSIPPNDEPKGFAVSGAFLKNLSNDLLNQN